MTLRTPEGSGLRSPEASRARPHRIVRGQKPRSQTRRTRSRVLAALRAQVPRALPDQPLVIVGPTDMVSTIVAGAAQNVVAKVAESLDESEEMWRAEKRDGLRHLVAAAHAWVDTYADCKAVEWFTFDRNTVT
jgi:hypothetical protein